MGHDPLSDHDTRTRLTAACRRYRDAYRAVEDQIEQTNLGIMPTYVFAVDRLPLDELEAYGAGLAAAERYRRACREALHAQIELAALQDPVHVENIPLGAVDLADLMVSTHGEEDDQRWTRGLGRFLSVLERARHAGCIYVDGAFQPVRSTEE